MGNNRDAKILEAIERMPKVELHVHFGGSIPHETIEKLAVKNGVDLEQLRDCSKPSTSRYGHLIDFLDSYRVRCKCLQGPEDFETACVGILTNLQRQNVKYAEMFIAPSAFRQHGIVTDDFMPGIAAGAAKVCGDGGINVKFILDVGRQFGTEQAWQTAREAVRYQTDGIIALGLGGDEIHYSSDLFVDQFAFARKEGLHRVAHAGEVGGPASIWAALKALNAERIGHGVGARGNDPLLEHLNIRGIPVEMCPTSNVKTGAVRSYADHPLPEFLRRGIAVTLNSDDPAMFDTTLTNEYKLCVQKLGLDWSEIKTLCINGVKATFLPDLYKKRLLEEFEEEIAEIEDDLRLR